MRRYRMLQAPVMAFFSSSFYRDVGLNWKGTAFGYLLLLLAICWIPTFIQFQFSVSAYIKNDAPALVSQIPPIRIIKGEAFADVAQPYKIIAPDTGKAIFLIDTTGATTSLEGSEARGLLTKTSLTFQKDENETRTISLKNIENFTLTQQRVSGWLKIVRNFSSVVFYLFAFIGSSIFRIIQALVYTVIGLLVAKLCRTRIPYQTLLSLALMAITPAIITATIVELLKIKIPLSGWIYFFAAMLYLFIGIKAMKTNQTDSG